MTDLHSTYPPVLLVVFIAMALAGLFPAKALGQTFGTVSLKEGESRRISIGPTFRDMRVCNDLKSAGSVMIKVGAGFERKLRPGQCAEDRGNFINSQNLAFGTARITYRALSEPSPRWYGEANPRASPAMFL